MDLHKSYLQLAVMNKRSKVLQDKNSLKQVGRIFFDENYWKNFRYVYMTLVMVKDKHEEC